MNISQTVTDLKNLAEQAVTGAIVKTIGSNGYTQINGYVFDIIDTEDVSLDSDITDHYIENNSAVQDHIALRPEKFTLRGYVAELKDIFPNSILGFLTGIQSMGTVGGLLPNFSAQAAQVYAQISGVASKVTNVINQAQNAYDMFSMKSTTASDQQKTYKYFYDLWMARTLCSIETPFGTFDSMAIESVKASQPGTSRFMSDFSVTFKKIRKAQTATSIVASLARDRAANMFAPITPKGQTPGQSFLNSGLSLSFPAGAGI